MGQYRELNELSEMNGKECLCNYKNTNVWDDDSTVKCKVFAFYIALEESFPYSLSVKAILEVIDSRKIDPELIKDLYLEGVSLDQIIFPPVNV